MIQVPDYWQGQSPKNRKQIARAFVAKAVYNMDTTRGLIVGHISRDSTSIDAREKPVRKIKIIKPKKKRGRPRKGEVRIKELTSQRVTKFTCDLQVR